MPFRCIIIQFYGKEGGKAAYIKVKVSPLD
jgi:hypothetical protein